MLLRNFGQPHWYKTVSFRSLGTQQRAVGNSRDMVVMAASKQQLLSVAPMMDWTDVHYRQLARLISRHTWLYTEMVVDQTLIHNPNRDRFLFFPPEQHPIVCQLGGSDPTKLAKAAQIVAEYQYDEINLNCGCPSDRVAGAGCFGAALMLQPQLVADCCKAVAEAVASVKTSKDGNPPAVTVKCRLGVDNCDSYTELSTFIRTVSEGSPVKHFIIHARKCHLKGLNPHQNRTIPPLRYEWIWALKRDFPHLEFSLNGGVLDLEEALAALQLCLQPKSDSVTLESWVQQRHSNSNIESMIKDSGLCLAGVMIGRAAYNMPWNTLGDADRSIFGATSNAATSRRQVLEEYAKYADGVLANHSKTAQPDSWKGPSIRTLVKPLMGMFHNEPRARKWRAAVDGALKKCTTVSSILDETLHILKEETLDAPPNLTSCNGKLLHFASELPACGEIPDCQQAKKLKVM